MPTFIASWRKQRSPRKTSMYASLTTLKPLTVWITTNCGKFFKYAGQVATDRSRHGTTD